MKRRAREVLEDAALGLIVAIMATWFIYSVFWLANLICRLARDMDSGSTIWGA